MLWQCTRRQTKVLLVATLMVFSAYGLLLAQDLRLTRTSVQALQAQAVGASASVPANQYNTLAQQLDQRERELNAREASLSRTEQSSNTNTITLVWVALMGAGLLGLILLNFYLDHERRQSLA